MELIDDVRDYLQLVIDRLEGMSSLNCLKLDISELKKEASRLSSIIVKRDNFNSNVKVLSSEYTVSRIVMKRSISSLDVHFDYSCEKYDEGCNCFGCWLVRRGDGFYDFYERFYREGIINDLIVQHHNMILLLRDKNSTKEEKELADSQRELTLTIAKQIFLKEFNKYKQQKIKDYEASKQ